MLLSANDVLYKEFVMQSSFVFDNAFTLGARVCARMTAFFYSSFAALCDFIKTRVFPS